jgi:hypothetical protein
LQAFDEAGERLAAVRTAVFLGGVEFGGGPVEFADVEQRIVAEAARRRVLPGESRRAIRPRR